MSILIGTETRLCVSGITGREGPTPVLDESAEAIKVKFPGRHANRIAATARNQHSF